MPWVHQIMYTMVEEHPDMIPLFTQSHCFWKGVAADMGARYHFWLTEELDCLVKEKYSFMWECYQQVKFPAMRAHIGSICILHAYGGMYVDMHVLPNQTEYRLSANALAICQQALPKGEGSRIEMQALAAEAGMSILSCWLDFIRDRLEQHVSWARAIREYIRDTTGAWTLKAFLEKQVQARSPLTLQYFKLNRPGRAYDPTHDEIRSSDFFTHRGTSYRTKQDAEYEILEDLPVSHERVCLPDACKRRRLCGKTPPIPQRLWSPAGCGAQQNVAHSQQEALNCVQKGDMKKNLDDCELGDTQQIVAPNVQNSLNCHTKNDVKERNESKRDELEAGRSEEIEALSQQDELKKSIEEESAPCLVADLNKWADDFLQQQESSSQQNASTASTEKDATDFRRP